MKAQEKITAQDRIRDAGLRCTQPRLLVLKQLMRTKKPCSIDDLHARLNDRVNIVTLYRILSEFVKRGLVYQTDFRTGKAYFEFQHNHHHHIVCTECGRTEDITVPQADAALRSAAAHTKDFAAVTHHALEFFGNCRDCAEIGK